MPEEKDISRRKVLATSSVLGSTFVGTPAVAAGQRTRDRSRGDDGSEGEIRKAFATMEAGPQAYDDPNKVQAHSSDLPEDFKILAGEHKNAEVPGDKPYAVENYDEYFARTAPPGFDVESQQPGDVSSQAVGGSLDDLYLQEDIGTQEIAGRDLTVGVGVGVKLHGNYNLGISATLSLDLFVEYGSVSGSVALSSFTLGYGVTENGLCFPIGFKHSYLRELDFEVCGDFGVSDGPGDSLEITAGLTVRVCADPCPGFTCSYCLPFSGGLSGNVTPPRVN